MNGRQKRIKFAVLLIVACLLTAGLVQFSGPTAPKEPLHKIRLAVPGFQSSALILLAEELGYLHDEGVDAAFEYRALGRDCLTLVTRGESDLAVVFETPVTHALLEGHDLSVITEMHSSERNTGIVARRDRGIKTANDLIGKKIAAVSKTNAEFLLALYLKTHLVDAKEVQIETMSVADADNGVSRGTVDAAALWEPYTSQFVTEEPDKFILLQSSFYSEFSMLVGLRENVNAKQAAIFAVMRALVKAEKFLQGNRQKAHEIVERKLVSLNFSVSSKAWDQMSIHLGLSSTLLTMLNEETKWYSASSPATQQTQDLKSVLQGRFLSVVAPRTLTFE